MKNIYLRIVGTALLIAVVGVFGIDYFSHLLFSDPMETLGYFLAKWAVFFMFSCAFLYFMERQNNELLKVIGAGIVVSLLWGSYYNVLPLLLGYYPFGIPLAGLTFLGMGLLGTGIAFGIVHTLAFVGGYYASRWIFKYVDFANGVH